MNEVELQQVKQLAEAHWEYSEELMGLSGQPPTEREHFLYIQAAIHFYKHAKEDKNENTN